MEKSTEKPIKAEIKDGKLILDGRFEANVNALHELLDTAKPNYFAESIDDILMGLVQLGSCLLKLEDISEKDKESIATYFPFAEDLFYLKVLSDSLKKM